MNWTVFRSSLSLHRVSFMWYSFGLIAYGWMIVAFFPLIERNPAYLEIARDVFSDELMAAFGGAGLEFTTLGGFLGIEYLSLMWILIVGAAVITFAAGELAGAIEDGTMEVTLSQPVSRLQVSVTRYLALAAYSVGLSFVTVAAIYLTGPLHDVDIPIDAMALLFVVCSLVALAMGGFAYFISALTSGKGRTVSISLGMMVAMYLANLLGNLNDDYSWLTKISLFHYWRPSEIVDDLVVASSTWFVFGIAALVFCVAGIYVFQRRDVV